MEEIQKKVKRLRKKNGWTQEELSQKIGVTLSTVQRWEKKGGRPTRLPRRELGKLFEEAGIGCDDNSGVSNDGRPQIDRKIHYERSMSQLERKFTNKTAVIGVVGLGYVGLPLAAAFAQALKSLGLTFKPAGWNQLGKVSPILLT